MDDGVHEEVVVDVLLFEELETVLLLYVPTILYTYHVACVIIEA